jgi:hypothetical protein
MSAKVLEGKIILRQWNRSAGLTETPQAFQSLDALYEACIATTDPQLIDRIIITGEDANGQPRVLTFIFQSITVTSQK